MSVSDAAQPGSVRKAQFAIVPMWVHRKVIATRTRTMALAVYVELVGQYAGSSRDAEGLRVWPEVQQIADSMGVPKSSVERSLKVLIDCGVVLKKRTMRRNQYWLPQEDPDTFTSTLQAFRTVTSDGPGSAHSVTSDGPGTVGTDGSQTVTSDGLYNPDPSIQTQETHLSLASVVTTAEATRGRAREERETLSPFEDHNPSHPAPLPGIDTYTTQLAAAAVARVPASRGAGTDGQQQGQEGGQAPPEPSAAPVVADSPADRIIAAYTAILGRPVLTRTRTHLHQQATEALAAGYPETWLTDRARELAAHGWTDLTKHVEKSTAPLPGTAPSAVSVPHDGGLPPWCGECGRNGMPARLNARFRVRQDGSLCHCHPDAARSPLPGTTVSGWLAIRDQLRAHEQPYTGHLPRPQATPEERAMDLGHF